VFRRAFEKRFAPLELEHGDFPENSSTSPLSESEWSGISDASEEDGVPVFSVSLPMKPEEGQDRTLAKRFMTSRPPLSSSSTTGKLPVDVESEDSDDADNIRNDTALQNLLSGKTKLFDSRSIPHTEQKNVPMRIQKGIAQKRQERDDIRRKEAKEAGVVLERAVVKKKPSARRDRGLGGPSVGKFRGGLLKLGRKDVQDVQGRGRQSPKKKR